MTAHALPTPLQVWLVAALDVLDDARAELNALEYETLLDIVAVRLAHDYLARVGQLADDEGERRSAA